MSTASPSPSPSPSADFSDAYAGLTDFTDGLGDAFSFLPDELSAIIVAALAVVAAWFIIKLAIQLVGMFF